MTARAVQGIVVLLSTALVASTTAACGGDQASSPGADVTTTEAAEEATTEAAEETTTEEAPAEVIDEACADQVGPTLDELTELDSRLNVGLNFERYSGSVSDISVEYDRIQPDELGRDCVLQVGVPVERAFNAYVKAYNIWNKCIGNINCDNDSIRPRLQAQWRKAETLVGRAEQNLENLNG